MIIKSNKKAAMFGLDCRVLRKQFGKLFLTSRHSEAPKGANGSYGYYKHGAMFGLDARIALAIFGALSVISGAALYSAIQSAKAEQWRQWFVERVKATEAYYLDNGHPLSMYLQVNQWLYGGDLNNNRESLSTWHGPYINANSNDGAFMRDGMTKTIATNASWFVMLKHVSDWASMATASSLEKCSSGSTDCAEWVVINSGGSAGHTNITNLFNMLDNLVDGGDGKLKGKVRFSDDYYLFYRSINRVMS